MSTFLAITQDIYEQLGHSLTPPTVVSRRIKRFVNSWHRRVVSAQGMASLRRVIVSQASVANQPTYGLVLNAIRYITETTTQRRLVKKTIGWYRERYPDPTRWTGTPDWWVPMGQSRIHTRPSAACELFIVSTQGADAGTVKIEAIRSTGYRVSLSKVLTGTTPVSLDTTITDVVDLVDVYLSAAQTGTVTVTQGSGGTELSRIPIGQTFPRFLRYALVPTPSQAITYTIDGEADLVDLVNDTDEPLIPIDFHDILVLGALAQEYSQLGKRQEAAFLLTGGNPAQPTPQSVEGRIKRLRASIHEWDEGDTRYPGRTFDESIHLPIT